MTKRGTSIVFGVVGVHALTLAAFLDQDRTQKRLISDANSIQVHFIATSSFREALTIAEPDVRLQLHIPLPPLPSKFPIDDVEGPRNLVAITVPAIISPAIARASSSPITELREFSNGPLSRGCARDRPESARHLAASSTLLLRVRVEENGRPSATLVIESSGDETRDEAIRECVLSEGNFVPAEDNGKRVASWRNVRWGT